MEVRLNWNVHGTTRQKRKKMPLPLLPSSTSPRSAISKSCVHNYVDTFRWCSFPPILLTYTYSYWFWSPLSPVLFNVCTNGLADPNQNGPSKILTLVDDGVIYKTSKDSQEAAEAVQQQQDSVSQWYHNTGSLINPDKAQTLVHAWQQSSRQTSASSHIWWSCGWTNKPSEMPWDPLW